jgi:enoyl-CoA hydratase/carnithine racemase
LTRTATPSAGLRVEHPAPGVRMLIFDRREARNSLDIGVLGRLADEVTLVGADPSVRTVLLAGANGAFCAGADFRALQELSDLSEAQVARVLERAMLVANALRNLPQPTIAAIDGPAVGAGMSLALACDIRIGSPSMVLLPAFIRMGLLPDTGASWLLPKVIGEGPALELLLSGRPVDAHRALRLGLVSDVCDDVVAAALELARTFAERPPAAVAATKRLLREAGGGGLAMAIGLEATAQAAAIHGGEFAASFATWRTSRVAD